MKYYIDGREVNIENLDGIDIEGCRSFETTETLTAKEIIDKYGSYLNDEQKERIKNHRYEL